MKSNPTIFQLIASFISAFCYPAFCFLCLSFNSKGSWLPAGVSCFWKSLNLLRFAVFLVICRFVNILRPSLSQLIKALWFFEALWISLGYLELFFYSLLSILRDFLRVLTTVGDSYGSSEFLLDFYFSLFCIIYFVFLLVMKALSFRQGVMLESVENSGHWFIPI